jgi:hypothetical protein
MPSKIGATTFSIMTLGKEAFSITTLSIMALYVTLSINDTPQQCSAVRLSLVMLIVTLHYYSECHYAECRYAECRGTLKLANGCNSKPSTTTSKHCTGNPPI